MSTALSLVVNNSIDMWSNPEKLKEIRKLVSPSAPLSDLEFSFLVELGRATQLNPFMKEIWAVKYRSRNRDTGRYEDQPAQIFIGRDGYRKVAQRHPEYENHQVNAIYSNDEFRIINDEIQHNYGIANRGELLGAYCIVKRKSSSKYIYVMVTMNEYDLKQGLWKNKPETMIKKVAEAQAMRHAFQEVLAGTYSDAELPQHEEQANFKIVEGNTQTEKLNQLLNDRVSDAEVQEQPKFIEGSNEIMVSEEQIKEINYLIDQKQLSEDRLKKAYSIYEITELTQLTDAQARRFIFQLGKV